MALSQQLNNELSRVFFDDIVALYPQSERQYDCSGISDIHYCQLGVLRCLSSSVTGQEFLQYHADQNVAYIEPGHFFKTLKSPRRLENITSLNDLLATPIVLLYKHRWDIEKTFHELKSKMNERKSWASSPVAKKSHALFPCLSHNLLLLCEKHLEKTEGLRDEVEVKKQAGRIKAAPGTIVQAVRNFINSALTRATQRTQRFIRWVRVRLYLDVPWSESMARLRELWTLPA